MKPECAVALLAALASGPALAAQDPTNAGADAGTVAPPAVNLKAEIEALRRDLDSQRALVESLSVAEVAPGKPEPLRIYGFTDMGINKVFVHERVASNTVLPTRATTFVGQCEPLFRRPAVRGLDGFLRGSADQLPQWRGIRSLPGSGPGRRDPNGDR